MKQGSGQRSKGQRGERQVAGIIADLTGLDVRRRVRQHDGDSDLEGVPGWTIEVKDHASATIGSVAVWWAQTVLQARKGGGLPLLVYRRQRGVWRAVWPVQVHLCQQEASRWDDHAWTVEASLECWAAVARELVPAPDGE